VNKLSDLHPKAPAGGGGPGAFKSPMPLGANPEVDRWGCPQPLGHDALVAAPVNQVASLTPANANPAQTTTKTDPEIEALDLSATAKKAAYELRAKHPLVTFTSGRRDKQEQASAMAENVVLNRDWIKETYVKSAASEACQKWVDDNKNKKTKDEIAAGLQGVLDKLTDTQLAHLSKHLSGDAFDVQPVEKDAEAIKQTIQGLSGLDKFLEKEGGLVRWHAQF
jgi:heme-binding NEAT domain protein